MTLDEKITLVGGDGRTYMGGSSTHTGGTFAIPRLGLPAVFFVDGPVGPRQGSTTALPIPMAVAATWNSASARSHGRVIATEARNKGNDVIYAPTVNIMRTPLNGRTYESYGEETQLVARTGVNWIQAVQQAGLIANVKHFAVNNQDGQGGVPPIVGVDGERRLVDARLTERTLRETYLPHFEAAVKQGGVGTVMCAYPRVNGEWACQNSFLLERILKREWRFKGFVLSDYGASKGTVEGLNNGLDFVPAQGFLDQAYDPALILAALASGQVSEATLDEHVLRILRTLFEFGYFDRAPHPTDDQLNPSGRHQRIAQQIEERAITLLKNDGVLPLKAPTSIAVIGPYADKFVTGGGSGSVTPRRVITALEGIRARAGDQVEVTYVDGSDQTEAARAAREADVAIVVVGDVETEGSDKSCMGLNCSSDLVNSQGVLFLQGSSCAQETCPLNGSDQDGLISQVAAAQDDTVVVLETGGPVLTPWRSEVAAILSAWYPGQEGGRAIARVLYGDAEPGGRLPVTFPRAESQWPTAGNRQQYPGVAYTAQYSEGNFIGYRWFDRERQKPAFPFGFGKSYTTFDYGNARVVRGGPGDSVATVQLRVTNVGSRRGVAVPQLYVSKPAAQGLPQAVRQLAAWKSVSIAAGRTVLVSLPLNGRSFATWDRGWKVLPGCYRLSLGTSSRSFFDKASIANDAQCQGASFSLPDRMSLDRPIPAEASARLLR